MVLPFKLRPQYGVFSKDLTLSGMGGLKHNIRRNQDASISAVIGVGISSITVDSISTRGEFRSTAEQAAITISTGLVTKWRHLQFGAFIGWDHLSQAERLGWKHQGAPWVGLGIGLAVFTEEKEPTVSDQ